MGYACAPWRTSHSSGLGSSEPFVLVWFAKKEKEIVY